MYLKLRPSSPLPYAIPQILAVSLIPSDETKRFWGGGRITPEKSPADIFGDSSNKNVSADTSVNYSKAKAAAPSNITNPPASHQRIVYRQHITSHFSS